MVCYLLHNQARGHQAINKMKLAARRAFYWRGMDTDIEQWVSTCACEKAKVRHEDPRGALILEDYGPFEAITMDIITDV
jgi:hypothetical protein